MTDKEIEALWLRVTGFNAGDASADIAGFARALLSASIADTAGAKPVDLLPNALWTRRGSGTDEWWSFKGYQARKDAADQWVLRKGGEELYRHTYLQVVMAHAERALLAATPASSVADAKCMCSGLGPCEKLSNCRKAPSVADAAGASEIRALIADDAYAMSFQTMGQYRSALLNAIKKETGK